MKIAFFILLVLTSLLTFSCGQNVKSSPIAPNEVVRETPAPVSTPESEDEINLVERFATNGAGTEPPRLEVGDYKIRAVKGSKNDADYDAVLSKSGKPIARFEGYSSALGSSMNFALFPFLGGPEKQLLVLNDSNRYDREWIVSLGPKFELLFDAADFDVEGGFPRALDINKDGVYELVYDTDLDLGFSFRTRNPSWGKAVFKFDSRTRKYQPAGHLLTEYTLKGIDKKIEDFKQGKKSFRTLLDIFMTYVYAGREDAAWKFFDENISSGDLDFENDENKLKTKEKISAFLKKNKIHRFIQNDLKKK
jgi:hypothetical protein